MFDKGVVVFFMIVLHNFESKYQKNYYQKSFNIFYYACLDYDLA